MYLYYAAMRVIAYFYAVRVVAVAAASAVVGGNAINHHSWLIFIDQSRYLRATTKRTLMVDKFTAETPFRDLAPNRIFI